MNKMLSLNRKKGSNRPVLNYLENQICDKNELPLKAVCEKRLGSKRLRGLIVIVAMLILGLPTYAQSIMGTSNLCIGATTTLSSSITGGTWSSSNSTISTVGSLNGTVTGIGAGTATITYSVSGSVATAVITIDPLPDPGTISGASGVCILSTITLSSSVSGGIWSANNAIATVDSTTGLVYGAAIGSDTIKYTVTNTCGSAYAAVNITISGVVGNIYTFAGTGSGGAGGTSGPAFMLPVNPKDLVTDNAGNVYYCQLNSVMKISNSGILTLVAGSSTAGNTGDGGQATAATLYGPNGVFVDNSGNIFIVCTSGQTVRKVNGSTGIITTIAGTYGVTGYTGDGGPATAAKFYSPLGICTDTTGNIYIADQGNSVIRMINHSTGIITTVAGTGSQAYSGDGGPATNAALNQVRDVKMDNQGNIYITDALNNVVRKYVPSTGIITTIAGTGTAGNSGDDGPATNATMHTPARLAYDGANLMYVSDQANNVIRQINLATGIISKSAGVSTAGFSGDYSSAISCQLSIPAGIAVDHSGNFFIADANNKRIRIVPSKGSIYNSISGPTSICTGTPVTFSSFMSVSGSATYQWQKNGLNIGSGSSSYTPTAPSNNDVYRYIVDITPACASSFYDTSNNITLKVDLPASTIVGSGDFACIGGTLNLTDSALNGTWTSSSTSVATVDTTGVLSGIAAGTTTITYAVSNTCGTTSSTSVVTVNPMVTISASLGPNGTIIPIPPITVCSGTTPVFTFTPNPGYHVASLSVNGSSVAPVTSYTFTPVTADQVIDNITFEPDCAAPVMTTCPANVTVNNDAGYCGAVTSYTSAAASGTSPTISYSQNSGTSFPVGTTTVTVNATNTCGTATCTFTVTVNDIQNPTITAPAAVIVNANTGSCYATGYSLGTPTTADNCGVANVTNNDAGTYSVGTHAITWTVTDVNGNNATATQNITVVDNQNPTITAPANVTVNANAGSCYATGYSLGTPTTADNCGVANVTNNDASTYSVGTHTITWTVTDVNGNIATATQNITVVDNQNPTITAPANVTVNANAGSCYATGYSLGTPTTADNCGVANVTNNDEGTYSVGTHTITWTVTDVNSNTATATQNITVVDNQNPTITAPAAVTANANTGSCNATGYSLGTPTTADNCGVANVTNNDAGTYSVGTHTITWTVTDVNGNTATATQNITVVDNQNPTITAPADETVYTNSGCTATGVSTGSPVTGDNCSVAGVVNNHSSATYSLGTNVVTWSVTDGSGNTAAAIQTITVADNVNPTITAPANITVNNNAGYCTATISSLGTPVTSDNCSVASVTNNHSSATYPVGTTTVTWTITDGSGNTATATQNVTVNDNQNPTITAPSNVTITGWCRAVSLSDAGATLGTPTTNDNCGVASVTNNAPSTFPVGTTTVTWTVTDIHGNTATATQNVTLTSGSLSVSASATNISCNSVNSGNHNNGSITTTVTGGTPSYSYTWSSGASGSNPTGLSAATYTVSVTDAHSCYATGTATVGQPTALSVTATAANVSCNSTNGGNHTNGSISTTVTGGTASYSYTWNGGATGANPSSLGTGTYSVTVTDAHSCTTTGSATVGQPSLLAISATATNVTCSGTGYNTDGSIATTITGGTSSYSCLWSCGSTSTNPTGLATGTYSVTVTDAHSCTVVSSATVGAPATVSSTITGSTNVLGNTTSTFSGPSGMTTYSWTITGGDHVCDVKCHHASGHVCGYGCDHYGVSCPSACHHHSGHVCDNEHTGDHHCNIYCHHNSGHICNSKCDHYGQSCTSACHHNTYHRCGHNHCGSATISGSATGSGISVANPCCATVYTLTLTASNTGGCSSTSSKVVTVTPSATINIYSGLYTTGSGDHPGVTKTALTNNLKVYDRNIVGARNFDQSNYASIYSSTTGLITNAVVSAPISVTVGSAPVYQYTINVPAYGQYLILGQSTVATTYYGGTSHTIYTGRRAGGYLSCDGWSFIYDDDDTSQITACESDVLRFQQVVKDQTGKVTEADTHQEFGSLMLVVTPVTLTFDDSLAYLPVVYESVEGEWGVSVVADPPYGFYSVPDGALSTSITDSIVNAVQFAITDTGSDWTYTKLTHSVLHKGGQRTVYSVPGMINNRTNKPTRLKIVPNPANNNIKINLADFEGKATIYVYNMLGQKVAEQPINVISGASVSMDISSLIPGVYLLTAENSSGKASARLIKKGE
jgi:hypothetical protein